MCNQIRVVNCLTFIRRVLDGQHRLVMLRLAERLGYSQQLYGDTKPTEFCLEVLQFNTPLWALHSLSIHHASQNDCYVAYSPFHTALSIARQSEDIVCMLGIDNVSAAQQYVTGHLLSVENSSARTAYFKIAHRYPDEAMIQLEYV